MICLFKLPSLQITFSSYLSIQFCSILIVYDSIIICCHWSQNWRSVSILPMSDIFIHWWIKYFFLNFLFFFKVFCIFFNQISILLDFWFYQLRSVSSLYFFNFSYFCLTAFSVILYLGFRGSHCRGRQGCYVPLRWAVRRYCAYCSINNFIISYDYFCSLSYFAIICYYMIYFVIKYYFAVYFNILYYTVSYHIILMLCYTMSYCIILFFTIIQSMVQFLIETLL